LYDVVFVFLPSYFVYYYIITRHVYNSQFLYNKAAKGFSGFLRQSWSVRKRSKCLALYHYQE